MGGPFVMASRERHAGHGVALDQRVANGHNERAARIEREAFPCRSSSDVTDESSAFSSRKSIWQRLTIRTSTNSVRCLCRHDSTPESRRHSSGWRYSASVRWQPRQPTTSPAAESVGGGWKGALGVKLAGGPRGVPNGVLRAAPDTGMR